MIGHVLGEMFSWPNGIVVGNLIASTLWAAPALAHLHIKLNRHHRALIAPQADAAMTRHPAGNKKETAR